MSHWGRQTTRKKKHAYFGTLLSQRINQTWDWGKVKKEENDAGGLGATPPEAEGFFCMSSQKTAFWSMKIRYLQVSKLYV